MKLTSLIVLVLILLLISCRATPPTVEYVFENGYVGYFRVIQTPGLPSITRTGNITKVYFDNNGRSFLNKSDFDSLTDGFITFRYRDGSSIPDEMNSGAVGLRANLKGEVVTIRSGSNEERRVLGYIKR